MKTRTEQSIEVDAPAREAYSLWSRFEDFPTFMPGLERVERLDQRRLRWVVRHAGRAHEWIAEITELEPDQRIAWSDLERGNCAIVSFQRLGADRTRITLRLEWEPGGFLGTAGKELGFDRRTAADALCRFRERLRDLTASPHGWRGETERAGSAVAGDSETTKRS